MANIPACLISVEASTGTFYWQRQFEKLGHKVKVISPEYVKPFVRGQKNDGNDAANNAICPAEKPGATGYSGFAPDKTAYCQSSYCDRLSNQGTAA